ncbi:MAG: KamA family radical SAM protein [Candidatus Diapherotrites archaeon]
MEKIIGLPKEGLAKKLWKEDPRIKKMLAGSKNLNMARDRLFEYLNGLERDYFNVHAERKLRKLPPTEKNNAKECIRVFKNFIRTENEKLAGFSALNALFRLAKGKKNALSGISEGFLCEFIFLFKGINGKTRAAPKAFRLPENDEKAALARSRKLDEYSAFIQKYFKRYADGLAPETVEKRRRMKSKILKHFKAGNKEWENYRWHLKHVIKDSKTLSSLVKLSAEEIAGVKLAEKHGIPFHITPYYLSLFNEKGRAMLDNAIRAQVLPTPTYCMNLVKNRQQKTSMDFMGERSTSPVKCVTRRYPQIVILKPFDSCPQICVYCQRNWEIKDINEAGITPKNIAKALSWIKKNQNITEVLVTGGDPLTLDNSFIDSLLENLSKIKHVERIRLGTRVLVTLPFRIGKKLVSILEKYHELGKRELCIVTHFEHASEITPEAIEAVKRIRRAGISVYNQQVFTYFNSRKYETALLRKKLKLAGIDPYYTFNAKGKEETIDFRVPLARLEQERKEEARFLPGIVRTDEPVFNVPKLGKSHLRAWQDHEPIMVLANGQRTYLFYPWESKVTMAGNYIYTDVSIYEYIKRLAKDREKISDYKSIWYYF